MFYMHIISIFPATFVPFLTTLLLESLRHVFWSISHAQLLRDQLESFYLSIPMKNLNENLVVTSFFHQTTQDEGKQDGYLFQ